MDQKTKRSNGLLHIVVLVSGFILLSVILLALKGFIPIGTQPATKKTPQAQAK